MGEQSLLHHVLHTARRERRAAVLLLLGQLLAQPGHRPVEMMQIEPLDADDGVILAPAIRGAVGAADEQPVQHREEHGALKRKTVLAFARQLGDHRPAAGLLPQPLEHQRRPDATDRNLDRGIIAGRAQHHGFGRKARTRTHQPLQLAARLQLLETPERGDHLLAHLVAVAVALDDLQIGAAGRGLAAEVHGGGSACWYAHRVAIRSKKSNQICPESGTTLSRKRHPAASKINGLSHVSPREV